MSESVPAALSIAYYAQNVEHCSLLCANLGGDTDTIGAMACAICGAYQGYILNSFYSFKKLKSPIRLIL